MIIHTPRQPARLPWFAVCDSTGEVFGPFDPGAIWFETPANVRGSDRLQLARASDLILNEAHAGWERLQRALCFLQPGGVALWRRFQEFGIVPEQTPALGLAGGLDVPAFLGDGGATGMGLHVDDSHNGTTVDGFPGASAAIGTSQGWSGEGPGGGQGGRSSIGAGGGGYGTAGGDGTGIQNQGVNTGKPAGAGGDVVGVAGIFEALRLNSFTREILGHGSGGGHGASSNERGANGGDAYLEIVHGLLTTVARTLTGEARSSGNQPGGGAGGLALLIAQRIAYGSGVIDVSGSAARVNGGAGGNGRVVQLYFDAFASNLMVTGGVQDQFRLLRSPTAGQAILF